jgi:hypothetical protein
VDRLGGVVDVRVGRGRWGSCRLGMWDRVIVLGLS